MARGGKILKSDIIDPGVKGGIEELTASINTAVASFKKLKKEAKAINSEIKRSKGFEQVERNAKKAATNVNKLTDAEKKLERATKALEFQMSKEGKQLAVLNEKKRQATLANKRYAQSQVAGVKSTNTFGKALGSFAFKFNALGNIAAMVAQRIARAIKQAIKASFDIVTGFEQRMADVLSITRANEVQFQRLSQSARDLGASTRFTAGEVAQLQKEYAKLGFSTSEILNASEATLNLAAATGSDLARSAEVAGNTLRGFAMDAQQTGRITDVMAESFSSSALDMEKFAESMKYVAPVAKVTNTSLEETTALLAILADSGISGSMAGTSLRMVFSKLAGNGEDLSEVLKDLSTKNISLADAQGLVGARAKTALLVLLQNINKLPELTTAFENAVEEQRREWQKFS